MVLPSSLSGREALGVVVREAGFDLLVRCRQGDPELQAVQRFAARAVVRRGAFGMHDAAAGGHPVDLAGADRHVAAEAVAVDDLAVEQKRDGGEADMRMRPHVDAVARAEFGRPEVIEEDEGADHAPLDVRQRAADRQMPEIDAARHDDEVDGVGSAARRREPGPCGGRSSCDTP